MQIPLTVSSQYLVVALNQNSSEHLTDGANHVNHTQLSTTSAPSLPVSHGFPVARSAKLPFRRGVTAKMSMNFNTSSVLPYKSQLSKVSPDIQISHVLRGSKILATVWKQPQLVLI